MTKKGQRARMFSYKILLHLYMLKIEGILINDLNSKYKICIILL